MKKIIILHLILIIIFCAGDAKMATMQKEEKLNLIPNPEWETLGQWESGDKNYKTNKALNALLNLGLLADWYLTDKGTQEQIWDKGYRETNPILGPKPNREQLAIYSLTVLLGNALLPKIIGNKYTDIFRAQQLKRQIDAVIAWSLANQGQGNELREFLRQNPWKLEIPFKF